MRGEAEIKIGINLRGLSATHLGWTERAVGWSGKETGTGCNRRETWRPDTAWPIGRLGWGLGATWKMGKTKKEKWEKVMVGQQPHRMVQEQSLTIQQNHGFYCENALFTSGINPNRFCQPAALINLNGSGGSISRFQCCLNYVFIMRKQSILKPVPDTKISGTSKLQAEVLKSYKMIPLLYEIKSETPVWTIYGTN